VSSNVWNPAQYERFRDERSQPFFDLLALVRPRPAMRVVDLGCGTGELTRQMHEQIGARETVGLDSSPTMLAKSEQFAGAGLRFQLQDIATVEPTERYDLVFSNAVLQWVDGHEALLERLTAIVAEGGQFAFQVPANDDHPSHRTAAEVAGEPPFRAALGGYTRPLSVLPPEEYARLLHRLGYREQHVRLQVYPHRLERRDAVVEWVKGAMLTDYERRLPAGLFDAFLVRFRERLLPQLEDTQPYFYPFKRLLVWGQR
jgi:trans-aconitate 2-methyltransferase